MKILLILTLFIVNIIAKKVDVDIQAQSFHSDESKNIVVFDGKVSMLKGKDTLYCDKIILKTKKNKTTNNMDIKSYTAIGNVRFTFKSKDGFFIGKGEKVLFDIDKNLYQIIGNGYLEDKINKKIIHGENIYFDGKSGYTKIKGTKNKPVKFKFTIESKE